ADGLLDQVFLAVLALQVVVGGLELRGALFAVRDEDFGLLFQEIQEVGAAQAEGAVHKTVEVGFTEKGQMAFEDHAIKAREGGDKGSGKLGEKGIRCLHGVRLQRVWVSNTTLPAERRLCFVRFSCGYAALGLWDQTRAVEGHGGTAAAWHAGGS